MEPLADLTFSQREELERLIPALKDLRIQYIGLCEACAGALLSGVGVEEAESRRVAFSIEMERRQAELIRNSGVEVQTIAKGYRCPICRDTGVVLEGSAKKPCPCRIAEQRRQINEQYASYESFLDFDESIYPDEEQKAKALALKSKLETYADRFPGNEKLHIHLRGNAGLGKTFFLRSLTRRLHERGVRCLYVPAYELFESFRQQHMGEGLVMPKYSRVPFLAIDDLGTEPVYRNITVEYFTELLDTRLTDKKPIALATNLDRAALTDRYGERITSRLYDQRQFSVIGLRGSDLRKQR